MATNFLNAATVLSDEGIQLENTEDDDMSQIREARACEISNTHPLPTIAEHASVEHLIGVGRSGTALGKFNSPRGVSIQEDTGNIYVADCYNHRIQIFSERGDYLNQFGDNRQLGYPYGILIHKYSIFVTDCKHHGIFLFAQRGLRLMKRVGKEGSGNKKFNYPRQLSISPNQLLYVADEFNNRIQILTCKLVFQGSLRHPSMTHPVDIKFSIDCIFVLSSEDNPCVHMFTLSGEKIRSIITRVYVVTEAYFFCLDACDNIIISDSLAHDVKIFSPEGDLLRTIGERGHQVGMFTFPQGIAILRGTKIVCVSDNFTSGLQILYV